MERSAALAAWIEQFAHSAGTDAEAQRFVDVIDAAILADNPAIASDPVLTDDLHRSTRAQWRAFLAGLPLPQHRLVLPEQALDLSRSLARRGIELLVLLKVYRSAHRGVFDYITAMTADLPPDAPSRDEILSVIWSRVDAWLDDSIEALIENFYAERDALRAGVIARRAAALETLLAGGAVDEDTASQDLAHPLRYWQTGFVVWSSEPGVDGDRALAGTARAVAEAVGGPSPLTHMAGSRDLWGWVATRSAPDPSSVGSLASRLRECGLHVALGHPAPGPVGFRTSHEEARAAQNLMVGVVDGPPIVDFSEVELLCMAIRSRDMMERLARRELGALGADDKNLALIRDTALAYLASGHSVEAAAEKLFVHRNTVRYRLARAADLVGHPLALRGSHVELALRYVAAFGPLSSSG